MSQKIAPGVTLEGPNNEAERDEALAEAKEKRQDAVWYVVMGVLFLFLAGFHWGAGVGGLFMVGYGAFRYAQWNARAKRLYDPWDDEELDAWEEEEFGR